MQAQRRDGRLQLWAPRHVALPRVSNETLTSSLLAYMAHRGHHRSSWCAQTTRDHSRASAHPRPARAAGNSIGHGAPAPRKTASGMSAICRRHQGGTGPDPQCPMIPMPCGTTFSGRLLAGQDEATGTRARAGTAPRFVGGPVLADRPRRAPGPEGRTPSRAARGGADANCGTARILTAVRIVGFDGVNPLDRMPRPSGEGPRAALMY